jgi:hypothetical protein
MIKVASTPAKVTQSIKSSSKTVRKKAKRSFDLFEDVYAFSD